MTFDIDLKSVIYFCVIVIEFGGFGVVCSEVTGSPGGDEPCGLIVGFCSVAVAGTIKVKLQTDIRHLVFISAQHEPK